MGNILGLAAPVPENLLLSPLDRLTFSHSLDPKRPFKAEVYRRKQAHCEPGRSGRKQSGYDQYVEGAWAMDALNPVQLDV